MQVCLLLCGGCAKERPAPARRSSAIEVQAPAGEQARALTVQVDSLPSSLNPLVSSDFWCQLVTSRTVFEPLVVLSDNGEQRPFLAAEALVEEGGRRFRFKLRPNVRFHDGRPLTSADVRYTFEAAMRRADLPFFDLLRAGLGDVMEVVAPDPTTVVVALRRPNRLFASLVAELPILPAHLYSQRGLRSRDLARQPVGTGPFRVVAAESGPQQVALARHERYWGQAPRVDRLTFLRVPDPARALALLRNGEVDIIPLLYPGYYPEQVKDERMLRRFRVLRVHPYQMRILVFNTRALLKDRRLRLAISHLVDRERLVREGRNRLGQVLNGPFWFLSPWYDQTIHPDSYDRQAAARLLDGAGWTRTGSKVRQRLGRPLLLRILRARESAQSALASAQIKAELRAEGIESDVQVGDFGSIRKALKRGSFELALLGLALPPFSDLSPLVHSEGELNLSGYDNPVVDRLLEQLRAASGEGSRLTLVRQLNRALHEDPPFSVLYAPIEVIVARADLKGLANNGRWPRLAALWR